MSQRPGSRVEPGYALLYLSEMIRSDGIPCYDVILEVAREAGYSREPRLRPMGASNQQGSMGDHCHCFLFRGSLRKRTKVRITSC